MEHPQSYLNNLVFPCLEHHPSPMKSGMVEDTQDFMDQVCLNKTWCSFLSHQGNNLPENPCLLAMLPLATGGARNVQTLLGFHKEFTYLLHHLSLLGELRWMKQQASPGLPPYCPPDPSVGVIRCLWRWRWVAVHICRGWSTAAGQQPHPWGDSSVGRLLLGGIPPRRDEPPVTLLRGRGHPPPTWAGPSLSPGLNSPSPPDPLFNSHTCIKAWTGPPQGLEAS